MSTNQPRSPAPQGDEPQGDPWAAFGYMVAGVLFYGGIGFGLDVWLDASYLLPIGIVVGAGFGVYMVFARYRYRGEPTDVAGSASGESPIETDRPSTRPADDDRGEQ